MESKVYREGEIARREECKEYFVQINVLTTFQKPAYLPRQQRFGSQSVDPGSVQDLVPYPLFSLSTKTDFYIFRESHYPTLYKTSNIAEILLQREGSYT